MENIMDIKELKKLIAEEVQRTKSKTTLKEQEEGYVVPSDPFNQSIFNEKGLDVMFNLISHQEYFPSIQDEITDILSEINSEYPLNNFKQLIDMRKNLELKLKNIALITSLVSSRDRKDLSKEQIVELLKQPSIRQSIEGMLVSLKVDSEKTADFITNTLPELIKTQQMKLKNLQPKTDPGTPSAKSQTPPIDPSAKTIPPLGSQQGTWDKIRGKKP